MNYRQSVELTLRDAVRNPLGLLIISLGFSVAVLPFSTTVVINIPFAWIAGLWTSCLLGGVVLVAGFRLTTEIAARHESISTAPFWAAFRDNWLAGLLVGALSFGVILLAVVFFALRLSTLADLALGLFGVYAVIGWMLLLGFSVSVYAQIVPGGSSLGSVQTLRFAFATGLNAILNDPRAALWLLIQAIGWSFIAIVTIVTPVLLLPGFLALLASEIIQASIPWERLEATSSVRIFDFG